MKTVRNDDSGDNARVPTDGVALDDSADGMEIRRKRIQDFRSSALAEEDHLRANIGVLNADFLEMALYIKEEWDKSVGQPANAHAALVQRRVLVDDYLRLARQFDRYAQLEIKLRRTANEG
jgi:hypothetical protein